MTPSWHAVWGGARGVVVLLSPRTRLLTAFAALLACLLAPVTTARGAGVAGATCGAWLLCCWPPARIVRGAILLSLILFLPYLPLAFLGHDTSRESLDLAWSLLARGSSALLVSLSSASTLSASDFREAVLSLPIPKLVKDIVVQVLHQAAGLAGETRRIAQAMAVRGASERRSSSWNVLRALPQSWLPRVVERAERVGLAMELRGYCEANITFLAERRGSFRDFLALGLAATAVAVAVVTRWAR